MSLLIGLGYNRMVLGWFALDVQGDISVYKFCVVEEFSYCHKVHLSNFLAQNEHCTFSFQLPLLTSVSRKTSL